MQAWLGILLATLLTVFLIAVAPYIQPPWIFSIIVILSSSVLFLIRRTKYPAIALMIISVLYAMQILSLFVLLGTLAIVVLGEIASHITDRESGSYIAYIAAATSSSLVVMVYLGYEAPLVVILGVLVAVLLKSALQGRYDSMMIESLGVAMTMFLFEELNFWVNYMLLFSAVIIALSFAYFSYRFKAADLSGLFSGAIVGLILIVFADVRWFLIMLTFFILGSACTRYRFEKKQELGVAEAQGGVRGYFNVFANGLVAVIAAVLFGLAQFYEFSTPDLFLALFLGSVASAAADTIASEIGVVGSAPYLITTFERVPHGTNGGVTLIGELAGFCAAAIVSITAYLIGVIDLPLVVIGTIAGFVGTNVDSIIGATLENEGKLGNSGTNLIATLCGGLFAFIMVL